MHKIFTILTLILSINIHAELGEIEKKYLTEFANYTGGMGIGFVPEHTYDYNFRQTILNSKDESIQKAFILYKLPYRISWILNDLKKNHKMIGKQIYRDLTPKEKKDLIDQYHECIGLLIKLDNNQKPHFYREYKQEFDEIINK